ncbi:MAG: ATPase domain-containing protein, partial [Candidatus Micrarchaeota archaeon]|nr:ATPase domain-containing protein [Candidatus Micrarchaeota archaeon]
MVDRAPTGIPGLDDLIEGGFPKNRTILVAGACGTGKSIFSMQFLYNGITEHNEPGVFVTFDESPENIRSDMMRFGWNLQELERKNLFAIVDGASARAGTPSTEAHSLNANQLDINRVLTDILGIARRIGAKRLVIDSIPALGFQLEDENAIRRAILRVAQVLSKSGMTAIVTTELPESSGDEPMRFSKYGVEEYVADGVILLGLLGASTKQDRTVYIRKMRGTK